MLLALEQLQRSSSLRVLELVKGFPDKGLTLSDVRKAVGPAMELRWLDDV
jgi:hypothetical protein